MIYWADIVTSEYKINSFNQIFLVYIYIFFSMLPKMYLLILKKYVHLLISISDILEL